MASSAMIQVTCEGTIISNLQGWPGWTFTAKQNGAVEACPPEGSKITQARWRSMPISTVLRLASREGGSTAMVAAGLVEKDVKPHSAQHLSAVREIYRAAVWFDTPPRNAITGHFEVSTTTADRWISKARMRGLLESWKEEQERVKPCRPCAKVPMSSTSGRKRG